MVINVGMYESGEKINQELKQLFDSVPIGTFTVEQRERILDIMIRFGSVAKFRCRSNVAYDNFVNCCLSGIATTERVAANDDGKFTFLKSTLLK